jgi:carboxyl-terminal processing protease
LRYSQTLFLSVVIGMGSMLVSGCAMPGKTQGLTDAQIEQNLASFDVVWETIRDTHWDPERVGSDWESAREVYRPQVAAATSMPQARRALRGLLGELGQSHFAIFPGETKPSPAGEPEDTQKPQAKEQVSSPKTEGGESSVTADAVAANQNAEAPEEVAAQDAEQAKSRSGTLGMAVRVIDGEIWVTQVRPGYPADESGIQPGWKLIAVDNRDVAGMLDRVRESVDSEHANLASALSMSATSLLAGDEGEMLALKFENSGTEVSKSVVLKEPPGEAAVFGYLPPMYADLESRRLAGGRVGYIAFNVFLDPARIMPAFEKAVREFKDCEGIIIDLRGNPGGLGQMSMGMAGFFVSKPGLSLGTMQTRGAALNFVVFPRPRPYRGHLAILIDELSGSTSEIMASGLRDLDRARLFGRRSAGAALPSHIRSLPNGDRLQHAVAGFTRINGQPLEGLGVSPDVNVIPSPAELASGRDPVLEAAQKWILSDADSPKTLQ